MLVSHKGLRNEYINVCRMRSGAIFIVQIVCPVLLTEFCVPPLTGNSKRGAVVILQ